MGRKSILLKDSASDRLTTIHVRLTPEMRESFLVLAKQNKETMSGELRKYITRELKKAKML
mgnify:CR=1 FL=1